ncbi:MAG TPA: shikimate kinase [Acidimicrobiales bacterium]|nr:shikimate kinase [Acidimicrobiales bacterium]
MTDTHIVLVGLMGTGKSTVGSLLAERLHRQFFDNDVLLERRTGQTAASIRRDLGEDVLHRFEAEVLLDCLATQPVAVIAAAASTVLRADVRDALREAAFVIWLRVDLRALTERLVDPGTRPLSGNIGDALAQQDEDREALYASIADVVLDTSARSAVEVAHTLIERLDR